MKTRRIESCRGFTIKCGLSWHHLTPFKTLWSSSGENLKSEWSKNNASLLDFTRKNVSQISSFPKTDVWIRFSFQVIWLSFGIKYFKVHCITTWRTHNLKQSSWNCPMFFTTTCWLFSALLITNVREHFWRRLTLFAGPNFCCTVRVLHLNRAQVA